MFGNKKNTNFDDEDLWLDFDEQESDAIFFLRRYWWVLVLAGVFLILGMTFSYRQWSLQSSGFATPTVTRSQLISSDLPVISFTPTVEVVNTPSPTPEATSSLTSPSRQPAEERTPPHISLLQQQMLEDINEARSAAGLSPVAWDPTATTAGQSHAADMAAYNYFSHWNREGLGPDHRYTLAGGRHAVMENLHTFSLTYEDGRGAPIDDWEEVIRNAQTGLMNSPGHRANILDPAHTHVGIGMAYDAATGQFRLAQEFTNQYVQLEAPLPLQAGTGDSVMLNGRIPQENISNVLLNLAYEPFPTPLSLEQLAQTNVYASAAESIETWRGDLTFQRTVTLGETPGLYHLRVFADIFGEQALILDHIIEVREE